VAVDCQEQMVRERNAAANNNNNNNNPICKAPECQKTSVALEHRTHTTAPINHTRPSPRKHSPDGVARATKQTRLQPATQFIDLERMKD